MPRVTFLGHSCCTIEEGGRTLLIDPFLTGNPLAAAKPDELRPTAVLVSHAHSDHLGDAIEIARRTGATIVSNFEIAMWCQNAGATVHPTSAQSPVVSAHCQADAGTIAGGGLIAAKDVLWKR